MNIIIRDLTDIKDHIKLLESLEHPIKKDSVTFRYAMPLFINETIIKTLFRLINEKYHPTKLIWNTDCDYPEGGDCYIKTNNLSYFTSVTSLVIETKVSLETINTISWYMPNICELSIHFSLNVTDWWIETLTFSKVLHTLNINASKMFIKEEERQYYDQHLTRFLINLDKNWTTNWNIVIDQSNDNNDNNDTTNLLLTRVNQNNVSLPALVVNTDTSYPVL
jgi:hypothetical protein